jgi:hypothetical protein
MKNRLGLSILVTLTLGLATFYPEPHIWKQLVNIYTGTFHQPIDWSDLVCPLDLDDD